MWALDQKHSGVVLVQHRPARAVLLAGLLGAILSVLPLVIAPELGPMRVLSFVLLALSSGALVFLGWPRPRRLEVSRRPGGIGWGDEPLPPPACVTLAGDDTEDPPTYQAFISWEDGRQRLALERIEPAEVLSDALELARRLELEVRPGWGLERHFPTQALGAAWESSRHAPGEGAPSPPSLVDLSLWPMQRRVAATTLAAALFVLVAAVVVSSSPDRSVGPGALSITLPVLTVAATLGLGLVLLGIRRRVALAATGIESRFVLFGYPFGKATRLGPAATRAFGVAPDRGPVRHVLFATSSGAVSVAADPDGAERLAAGTPSSGAPERLASEPPLATSARYRGPDRPARLRS